MDKARALFALRTEAGVHAAGLKVPTVGAAGDFTIGLLARQPDLKIIGFAGRKAHVARTEQHAPEMQAKANEDRFGGLGHPLMFGI